VLISGTAAGTRSILRRADLAGKTGTTNDYRDAWFDGYSNDVLATVWVGRDDNTPLPNKTYGATIALPIWTAFMKTALEKYPNPVCDMNNPAYNANDCNPPPAGITTASIDPETGYCSNDEDSVLEYFMPETSCTNEPEETTNPDAASTLPPPSDAPKN
jgi:penicillin-binding protein 1A